MEEIKNQTILKSKIARKKKIPGYLIYEILDGKPFYYQGYEEVMKGKKTLEEVMGSSSLQAVLVFFLNQFLIKGLDTNLYFILSSEVGLHIDHKDNLSIDIAIYESNMLTPDKINTNYLNIPPKLVIEIDCKVDLSNQEHQNYVNKKTQKLLDFGTEKVIWVFTESQKVLSATQDENWQIMSWHKDVLIWDKLSFNIGKYLLEKGIEA